MLVWELIKKNNSFLVKSNGVLFSKDHHNLTNVHSFKYSGLANPKAIGVCSGREGKGVVIATHTKKGVNCPAKHAAHIYVKSSGVRRVAKVVKSLSKQGYRQDLEAAALARVSAIIKSQKAKKVVTKPKKLRGKKALKA